MTLELGYASAEDVLVEVAELFRPALRIRPSEAAAKYLFDHKNGQAWDPTAAPYMVEPLDTMASREHEVTALVGPARSSKSYTLVMGGLTYIIKCDAGDTSVIHMNQDEGRKWSRAELSRTFEASPELGAELGTDRGDDNIDMKLMRKGMALHVAYPSIGCVSAKTLRWMFITDADNLTGELPLSDLFPLTVKRTQTFLSAGHTVIEGNPAEDYADPNYAPPTPHSGPPARGIVSIYHSGDMRRFYWFCPHCGEPFQAKPGLAPFALLAAMTLEEQVELVQTPDWPMKVPKLARVVCPANGCEIEHGEKRDMNLRGVWLRDGETIDRNRVRAGTPKVSKRATFWVAGVMAAYQSWESMVEQYLLAVWHYATTGEDTQVKQRLNVDFALPHIPLAILARRNDSGLAARAEEQVRGHVPGGVRFLVASVDVQRNRFVVLVEGFGVGQETWVVDRFDVQISARPDGRGGFLPVDPAGYIEDWDLLIPHVIDRRFPLADASGREMGLMRVHIDMGGRATKGGGKVTERAYTFWRSLRKTQKHARVRLVKGSSSKSAPRVEERYPDTSKRTDRSSGSLGDVPVVFVNTLVFKDAVSVNLQRGTPGPGYMHFPKWLDHAHYEELRAETRTLKGWENLDSSANEGLDLTVYNRAAAEALGAHKFDWDRPPPWAADWDKNTHVQLHGEPKKPAAPRRRAPAVIGAGHYSRN